MPDHDQLDLPTLGLFGGGCLLILGSLFAGRWLDGRQLWSESLANQLQVASAQYHDAVHASLHNRSDARVADQLEQAKTEYERLSGQLQSVQGAGQGASRLLKWVGIVLCVVGAGRLAWRKFGTPSA